MQASRSSYFVAAEAESIADEAAIALDEADSIADEAAIIDDVAAADAELSVAGGVTMVVDDGGVDVVVVVSSFLLQAAKETAAASVTMSNAVFIFLLDRVVRTMTGNCGNPLERDPSVQGQGKRGISRA